MNKFGKIICGAALSAAIANGVLAQKAGDESFRRTAPAPLAEKPFNLPNASETVLPNGLKVVLLPDKRLPIVSYGLGFRQGSAYESETARGLTTALAGLLKEGTTTRTSKQIAEEIEQSGASLEVDNTPDTFLVTAASSAAKSSAILNMMADIVLSPTFPANEVTLYKSNIIKDMQAQRANPEFLAREQVARIIYGTKGYGVISPAPADIEKIDSARLKEFHKSFLTPNNAVLIIVGDINPTQTLGEIKKLFGDWQRGSVSDIRFDAPAGRTKRTITVVNRPGSSQSNIVLANAAIERTNPDFFAVRVMNQVLGANASSRLFMNLRESKSYTYGAYSNFSARRQAGTFEANAEVRTPVTGDALKEFFYELERIRTENVTDEELRNAKSFLTGVFPISHETQESLLNALLTQKLYDLPADYLQTYRQKINAVTIQDVRRVAEKYISPDKTAIVIVGDGGEILKQVKPFAGDVEVFDINGKSMSIDSFNQPAAAPTVNITGKWNMTLDIQGQSVPLTLELKQEGDKVNGSMNSALGSGVIESGKISGNKLNAPVKVQMQGQTIELSLVGEINGDEIKGVVNSSLPNFPAISFSGKLQK